MYHCMGISLKFLLLFQGSEVVLVEVEVRIGQNL